MNLICRDQSLRQAALEKIQAVFHQVYSCKLQDDVNEVVFALPNGRTSPVSVATGDVSCPVSQSLNNALSSVQDVLQKTMASSTSSKPADVLDLTVKLAGLAMLWWECVAWSNECTVSSCVVMLFRGNCTDVWFYNVRVRQNRIRTSSALHNHISRFFSSLWLRSK